jgi:type III pantothenate kinase
MLLAIDIGNTNSVFAVYDGDALFASWRCQTLAARTQDEYAAFLQQVLVLKSLSFEQISAVIVASVVPAADRQIVQLCRDYIGQEPVFVTALNADVKIDLPQPEQVGADRIVNAVAVQGTYDLPAVVIDFGTATTFDVIDGQGTYLGGTIAPGIHLSMEALSRATAKLPKVSVQKAERAIAKSTDEAIQSGLFWGYCGLIEKILGQITKELGAVPSVIATGGLAPLFADHIKEIDTVDEMLTLRGLLMIYKGFKQ